MPCSCSDLARGTMNSLFQAEDSSKGTGKKVAVAIAVLVVFGLGVWLGGEMALRLLIKGPVSAA